MMEEKQMRQILFNQVAIVCNELSDQELAALNIVAQLDQTPHGRIFNYDDVASLFTENDGLKMHSETKLALATVVNFRLFKKEVIPDDQ